MSIRSWSWSSQNGLVYITGPHTDAYVQVRMDAVADTERIFVLHLKPVADLLTNLDRRHERLRFGLNTAAQRTRRSFSSFYHFNGIKFDLDLFHDIIHDNTDVDIPLLDIVDPNVTHTRGHSFKIIKQQCRINARLNSFACRNVNAWNVIA